VVGCRWLNFRRSIPHAPAPGDELQWQPSGLHPAATGRALIEEGLASRPGGPRIQADEQELLAIARGEID